MDFTGKLVVITGVGRAGQVGEAVALGFAQRGATLALLDMQQAEVDARADVLRADGHIVSAHSANLSDAAAAKAVAEQVIAAHPDCRGAVHAMVHVAGGFGATGPLDVSDPEAWHKQFMINLDTAYGATRAFLPALRLGRGALVYFGSVAALPGGSPRGIAAYAAAKSAVLTLMRAVAAEEWGNGVRANAVAPTQIRTAANMTSMKADTEYVERESVADVVAFLASAAARNITGQVITLA